jgi:uracil-DNA glycosylase family 4
MDDLFTRAEQRAAPAVAQPKSVVSLQLLHKMECRACPLNKADVCSPKMQPEGPDDPLIYVLDEYPSKDTDERGVHLSGGSGKLFRGCVPEEVLDRVRYNSVIRTRPPNRVPDPVEIECCRPSIVRDIERTKPKAIIGLGNIPLQWLTGYSGIEPWRGRRMPVRVGSHVCWFFPVMHPAYVLKMEFDRGESKLGKEYRWAFKRDIQRAVGLVLDGLPVPVVHGPDDARNGVERIVPGPGALRALKDAVARITDGQALVGIDLETTKLRPFSKGAAVLSVALSNGTTTVAFPFDHPAASWGDERNSVVKLIRRVLLDSERARVAHNAKFEIEWCGVVFGEDTVRGGVWECSQAAEYILDCRAGSGVQSLGGCTMQEFGLDIKRLSTVDVERPLSYPVDALLEYNGMDAAYSVRLLLRYYKRLSREGLLDAYKMHVKRLPTLAQAQIDGVPVDQARVRAFDVDLGGRADALRKEIAALPEVKSYVRAVGRFNPESSEEVAKLLRDHLKRKEGEQRNGKYSTDKEALDKMKDCAVAGLVLKLRAVTKLHSTYITPLLPGDDSLVYPDGLLHTNFNTTFTDTGRLSSDEPNLQNYPKRRNAEIRAVVAPRSDEVMIAADYGQIEARVIAMASRDKRLVDALWHNYDIHMAWAERVATLDDRVLKARGGNMKVLRSDIKNMLVFPAFYGAFPASIGASLQMQPRVVDKLFDEFWSEFAGVKTWQEDLLAGYERDGYVSCLTGRRRYGPLNKNMIINSPVQGTASDLVVGAMNRLSVHAYNDEGKRHLQARMNIHDDLTFIVPKRLVDESVNDIVRQMVRVKYDWINVPISVEVAVGPNWHELKEVGKFESHKMQ